MLCGTLCDTVPQLKQKAQAKRRIQGRMISYRNFRVRFDHEFERCVPRYRKEWERETVVEKRVPDHPLYVPLSSFLRAAIVSVGRSISGFLALHGHRSSDLNVQISIAPICVIRVGAERICIIRLPAHTSNILFTFGRVNLIQIPFSEVVAASPFVVCERPLSGCCEFEIGPARWSSIHVECIPVRLRGRLRESCLRNIFCNEYSSSQRVGGGELHERDEKDDRCPVTQRVEEEVPLWLRPQRTVILALAFWDSHISDIKYHFKGHISNGLPSKEQL